MTIHIRQVDPENDLPQLAELLSRVSPQPVLIERLQELYKRVIPVRRLMLAVDEQGTYVGYSRVLHEETMLDGHFSLWMTTHPSYRRQGIATLLYHDALQFLQAVGMTELVGQVEQNDPSSLRFAQGFGFAVHRHYFRFRLDLSTFNETPFITALTQAEQSGIRFFTLADVGDTLEHRRKVYELNRMAAQDIPGRGPFFSFEEYHHLRFEREAYCADGVMLAAVDNTWIGLSQVSLHRVGNFMFNEMTGVLKEYRGYKIAQALKLLAARCARSYGVAELKTFNDSENAPMLAINRKMGYQAEVGFYTVKAVFA